MFRMTCAKREEGMTLFITKHLRNLVCLAVLALIVGSAGQVKADPVLTFDENTGGNAANQNQSVGWQFNVLQPLTVIGLGWFDERANGLVTAHTVGIWSPDGTLLTSVLVPAGTAAPLDGQFRAVFITPLVLPVGNGYIVGGENFFANTERLADNASQMVDPRIRYIDATFSTLGSGFTRPNQFSLAVTGFYGPSFSVKPIPEPATIILLSTGLAGVGAAVRKRRKANQNEKE